MNFQEWLEANFGKDHGFDEAKLNSLEKGFNELHSNITKLQDDLTKVQSDLEYQKGENKKAYEVRDKVKKQYHELLTSTDGLKEVAEQNQQLTKLNEELTKQVSELQKNFETTVTELKTIKDNRRKELLSILHENAEERKFAEMFTLDELPKLESFVKLYKDKNGYSTAEDGKSGKSISIDPNRSYDDYSSDELENIKSKRPDVYKTLYKKKYGKDPILN